ncbi:hypothetical protein HPB49_010402 [Dermacentor silvarum]|uniref:Uncharacterized protein n=1 Tax=Dermacentor silvarum TaxID=543639 RepID=A0ACB8C306_DERSI|nr:hypothetical protein HPB49_010402 [Dermacentor silvarum]
MASEQAPSRPSFLPDPLAADLSSFGASDTDSTRFADAGHAKCASLCRLQLIATDEAATRLDGTLRGTRGLDPGMADGSDRTGFGDNPRRLIFINNEFVDSKSGKTFATFNPVNEEKIADVQEGSKEDIDAAVKAAREAFRRGSKWRTMDASQRGTIINSLADLMEQNADYMAVRKGAIFQCGRSRRTNSH